MERQARLTRLRPAEDYRERWRRLLAWLDARPGERVLDVGCRHGAALRYVARCVGGTGRAVGLEVRPDLLAALREEWASGRAPVAAVVGLAQALPFRAGSFDAALCVNVLEAVPPPERVGALRELRRILQPAGRALVAHDDWESLVYAGADRDLTRRSVRAYADATLASYAASDGQMGRHLLGLMRAAGFRDVEVRALPLVNTDYRQPLCGWVHSRFDAGLVAEVNDLTQQELDDWRAQLQAASDRGEYFFCATLYACLGRA